MGLMSRGAVGSACHRGADLSCELIPIIPEPQTDSGYIPAWESEIRAKWSETNLHESALEREKKNRLWLLLEMVYLNAWELTICMCAGERHESETQWEWVKERQRLREWQREGERGGQRERERACALASFCERKPQFVLTFFFFSAAFHLIMSTLRSATAWLMLHFHEENFNSTSSALNAHPIMRLSQ